MEAFPESYKFCYAATYLVYVFYLYNLETVLYLFTHILVQLR